MLYPNCLIYFLQELNMLKIISILQSRKLKQRNILKIVFKRSLVTELVRGVNIHRIVTSVPMSFVVQRCVLLARRKWN